MTRPKMQRWEEARRHVGLSERLFRPSTSPYITDSHFSLLLISRVSVSTRSCLLKPTGAY